IMTRGPSTRRAASRATSRVTTRMATLWNTITYIETEGADTPSSSGSSDSALWTPASSPPPGYLQLPALSRLEHDADRKIFDLPSASSFGAYPDPGGDVLYDDTTILLQPETRPISQEQLANEAKGIYAGLVTVEKKCEEICRHRAQTMSK